MRVSSADLGQLVFLAEGGFAKVFRAQEFVLPGDETPLAYKQFTFDHAEQARSAVAVVAFRAGLSPSDRAELDQFCAWPRALVEDESGELCGLLMPLIPEEFFCRYEDPTSGQITAMPREMSWLVASEAQRNASMIDLEDVDHPERLTLLAQLVYIIARLHEHGWVFGDISFKNAVFAVGSPRMMLLDCDGAAALTDFDRRQISTPMWDPPECHIGPASNQRFSVAVSVFSRRAGPRSWRAGPRSEQTLQDTVTDVYKLGLAILRCLTPGKGAASSRTVSRLAGELDAEGTDLVTRALSAYRASRPTARELYTYLYGVLSPSDQAVLPRIDALRRPVRPLAGVRSDAPSPEDLLGAAADAEMLADLIAAAETAAPLAIALIGDWGSGKSSVMLQIQRRIDVLAEMSRNDPGRSMFTANVRQVRFNAWDYSEDQVWSGLVEHLFRALATEPAILATPGDHAAAHAERASLAKQLADREAEERHVAGELTAANEVARPRGYLAGLSSPAWVVRVMATAIGEVGRDVRENVKILLGWAVLGAAAAGAWFLWGSLTGATAAALAAMLSPAIVVGRRLRSWHRAGVDFVGAQRRRLDARQRTLRREIAQLKERLALADAATRLSAFLADRAGPDAYRQYRSLLGQVRGDLRQLSDDLNQARREWLADGASGAPPLERIVLYIDDLDRCPPQKVVEVLEAIHLMLALELFVVVVAVDARWLTRSLEHHYRELFGHPADTVTSSSRLDVNGSMASPADYLDKIFQIPYALTPPPPAALASYLRSLLPLPVSRASAPQPMMEGTASAQADPEELSGSSPSQDALRASRRDDSEPPPQINAPGIAIPDLRPLGLQLTRPEVEFMARLGTLLPTPRAAKRLANLYRLVRIGIPDTELVGFAGSGSSGPYQAVQILLAMLVGSPAAAQRIFRQLMDASPDSEIHAVLDKAAAADGPEQPECLRLSTQVATIAQQYPMLTATREYQRWCPTLARHSFHTRGLTAKTQSPSSDQSHVNSLFPTLVTPSEFQDGRIHERTRPEPGQPAMPFYLVCDVSDRMEADLAALNDGIKDLRRAIMAEPVVDDVAQMCIISFSDSAKVLMPMGQLSERRIPVLAAEGDANYGAAFRLLAQTVGQDIAVLKEQGYLVYRPCAFFFTAGVPLDHDWRDTLASTLTLERQPGEGTKTNPIFVPFGLGAAPEDVLKHLAYPPGPGHWYHTKSATVGQALTGILDIIMKSVIGSGLSYDPEYI